MKDLWSGAGDGDVLGCLPLVTRREGHRLARYFDVLINIRRRANKVAEKYDSKYCLPYPFRCFYLRNPVSLFLNAYAMEKESGKTIYDRPLPLPD